MLRIKATLPASNLMAGHTSQQRFGFALSHSATPDASEPVQCLVEHFARNGCYTMSCSPFGPGT